MSAILLERFLEGKHTTPQGYALKDVLSMSDEDWEICHDFIQWAFPLPEKSSVHPEVPTATAAELRNFSALAKIGSQQLFTRFLHFLGLELSLQAVPKQGFRKYCWWIKPALEWKVVQAPNFNLRRSDWLDTQTHNDLRITRILRSLTLQELERPVFSDSGTAYPELFYAFLAQNAPDKPAMAYWTKAMDPNATF